MGLTLGYLELVVIALLLFASGHRPSRIEAYEADAVGSLRTLNLAIPAYAIVHPEVGFPRSLQDLGPYSSRPGDEWQIDAALASGTKFHYRFTYLPKSKNHGGVSDTYQLFADPLDSSGRSSWHFFTDESGSIRKSEGSPANETSEQIN